MSTTTDTMPMSRTRLYTEGPLQTGAELELSDDRARYLGRVLRLRPADELVVFDGHGGEYRAVIGSISKGTVRIAVGQHVDADQESPLAIHLLQGLSRGERMDFVMQKATELGVRRITPVVTEYSLVKLDDERAAKRIHHFRGVTVSACEQSGRNVLPVIDTPIAFREWLGKHHGAEDPRLVLKPGAKQTLKSATVAPPAITVLIGPEGGLSEAEYGLAEATGFQTIGMGPRVLRTETAALAVISALQALYGDLA